MSSTLCYENCFLRPVERGPFLALLIIEPTVLLCFAIIFTLPHMKWVRLTINENNYAGR